jgi:hypothetical protein
MKANDGCVTEDSASSSHSTEPHYVRITGHGQMRTWVQFALEFLEVCTATKSPKRRRTSSRTDADMQKHPTRPLVFHTLPLSAVPGAKKATPDPTKSPAPEAAPKQSTVNIPLLISVVEIVKREYLQACRTSCVGLHQYNEVRCLEELASHSTNEDDDPEEPESTRGEKAEEARRRELVEVLGGKRQ